MVRAAEPAAMTTPPASTNFLTLASAVAPVPVPVVTWQRLRRSGSVDGAAGARRRGRLGVAASAATATAAATAAATGRNAAPDGITITSYFDRSAVSSKPAPQTMVKGNSKRSSRYRVQPDGIDPVCRVPQRDPPRRQPRRAGRRRAGRVDVDAELLRAFLHDRRARWRWPRHTALPAG